MHKKIVVLVALLCSLNICAMQVTELEAELESIKKIRKFRVIEQYSEVAVGSAFSIACASSLCNNQYVLAFGCAVVAAKSFYDIYWAFVDDDKDALRESRIIEKLRIKNYMNGNVRID